MIVIMAFFGIGGVFPEEFVEDRKKTMIPPGLDLDGASKVVSSNLIQLRNNIERLEGMLRDGRPFLLGEAVTGADLSAYHPLMLLGMHPRTQAQLEAVDHVQRWMDRVRKIGHGEVLPFDSESAISVARDSDPADYEGDPVLPEGMGLGDPVLVVPAEYGSGNVMGKLAASGISEIAVRRSTERAGDVVVHFPREDYAVVAL